jgi:hypothetical protein
MVLAIGIRGAGSVRSVHCLRSCPLTPQASAWGPRFRDDWQAHGKWQRQDGRLLLGTAILNRKPNLYIVSWREIDVSNGI